MRRIVMYNHVTADGYFAGPDGNLGWVAPDEELQAEAMESMPGIDMVLFGRRTYEQFASFWPKAIESPEVEDPHGSGHRSKAMHDMGVWLDQATKLVFTRTLKKAPWRNTRLLSEIDAREIQALKDGPGGDMIIFGSGTIVSQLTQHGLIDDYHFLVDPILLGGGQTMIKEVSKTAKLDLVEAKTFRSGVVRLRYTRANS